MTRTYSSFAETSLGGSLGSSHRPGTAIEPGLVARGIIDVVPGSVFSAVCGRGVDAWHAASDLDRMGWTLAYRSLTKTDAALRRIIFWPLAGRLDCLKDGMSKACRSWRDVPPNIAQFRRSCRD